MDTEETAGITAGIAALIVVAATYLAGLAGCVYIAWLVIQALKKYIGA